MRFMAASADAWSGASASTRITDSVPLSYEHAAPRPASRSLGLGDGVLHAHVLERGVLVRHAHGHLRLRQQLARSRELRERLALGTNHFHHAQRGHNAVARALDIAKDRMARLLAA